MNEPDLITALRTPDPQWAPPTAAALIEQGRHNMRRRRAAAASSTALALLVATVGAAQLVPSEKRALPRSGASVAPTGLPEVDRFPPPQKSRENPPPALTQSEQARADALLTTGGLSSGSANSIRGLAPIHAIELQNDAVLRVSFTGAGDDASRPCGEDYSVSTVSQTQAIVVAVHRHPGPMPTAAPGGPRSMCSGVGEIRTLDISVGPLNGRAVFDLDTGKQVPVSNSRGNRTDENPPVVAQISAVHGIGRILIRQDRAGEVWLCRERMLPPSCVATGGETTVPRIGSLPDAGGHRVIAGRVPAMANKVTALNRDGTRSTAFPITVPGRDWAVFLLPESTSPARSGIPYEAYSSYGALLTAFGLQATASVSADPTPTH